MSIERIKYKILTMYNVQDNRIIEIENKINNMSKYI